jgi:predicted transcriptional regulator
MKDNEATFYRVKQEAGEALYGVVDNVNALEFRRDQYGFTQAQFAEILQMRPSHYSEFINGKRELPKNAIRRAIAIGVPPISALNQLPIVI